MIGFACDVLAAFGFKTALSPRVAPRRNGATPCRTPVSAGRCCDAAAAAFALKSYGAVLIKMTAQLAFADEFNEFAVAAWQAAGGRSPVTQAPPKSMPV